MKRYLKWISSFIAIGLSGWIFYDWSKVLPYLSQSLQWLTEPRCSILGVAIILLIAIGGIFGYAYLKNRNNELTATEKAMLEMTKYTRYEDSKNRILYEWKTRFSGGNPVAYNLKMYCLNHGEVPQLIRSGQCLFNDCRTNHLMINEYDEQDKINSYLAHKYRQIRKDLNCE